MALKFNGTSTENATRWYNTATGEIIEKKYDEPYFTEIEFSRAILKTKKRNLVIHPDHKPDKNGFWFNGYQADENQRITFSTGVKDKLVISKNEVDFMFCSTDQSFSSCYRLERGVEGELKEMSKAEDIYIVYTTQEDGEYTYKMKKYIHPKMSGRAFLYASKDHKCFTCGRPYGKTGFEIRDVMRRWLPSGLSIEWELNDDQQILSRFQQDNFNGCGGKTIHDRWDKVFDTLELYTDGLPLIVDGNEIDGLNRTVARHRLLKKKMDYEHRHKTKDEKNENGEIYRFM